MNLEDSGTDTDEPEDDEEILQNIFTHYVAYCIEDENEEEQTACMNCPDRVEIFAVNNTFDQPHDGVFMGSCIDPGAQRTVIGNKKALDNSKMEGENYQSIPRNGGVKYYFGDLSYDGLGKIDIRIPVTETNLVYVEEQVVDVYATFILGLGSLSRLKVLLTSANSL